MEKTTFKEKIGYGIASIGDAVGYNMTGAFLLFFLTTVAGISPGIAGTITALGAVWNAIINPVIGYFADKVNTKMGRRRPLILFFSIPLALTLFMLFTDVQLPMGVKPFYYGILLALYWTSYTGFLVPYLALGVDYTSDYDDRTALRLVGSFFNMVGSMVAMVMPTMMVAFIQGFGFTAGQAWSMTGLFLGIFTLVTNMMTVIAAKSKDKYRNPNPAAEGNPAAAEAKSARVKLFKTISNMVREYVSVAMLKPMRPLIIASLSALIGSTMIMSDLVYFLTFNVGMTAGQTSVTMLGRALFSTALIPIIGKLIALTDRRYTMMGTYIAGCAGMCLIKFVTLPVSVTVVLYMFFVSLCTAIYWQIMPGIFYDVCEYDRIKNDKNRAATIVSFQGLVESLAAGAGAQLLGLILEIAGFDGESAVQTETAGLWIENSTTVVPLIFLVITIIALYKYPLNKKAYNRLMESERKKG